jgi:hypothetical protein
MSNGDSRSAEARRRAEEKFAKAKRRDSDVMEYQRQILEAETAKFTRLRALRLAKEAADKAAEGRATGEAPAGPKPDKPAKRAGRAKPAGPKSEAEG